MGTSVSGELECEAGQAVTDARLPGRSMDVVAGGQPGTLTPTIIGSRARIEMRHVITSSLSSLQKHQGRLHSHTMQQL